VNQWLEQHRTAILVSVAILIAASVALFAFRWRQPTEITIHPPPPSATPGPIRVYISGAVNHPDVYSLPAGTIIKDAITLAGGAVGDADLNRVNLAQPLTDGQQIYVPRLGEAPLIELQEGTAAPVLTGPINLNTATQAELESLPGIGPALAERIIRYREQNGPFARIEDIQNVSGIGPSIFEQIKDLIVVN
jgi:competence protein ComEA